MLVAKSRDATYRCCYAAFLAAVREMLLLILIVLLHQHRTESFAPPTCVPTLLTATTRIQSCFFLPQFSRQHCQFRPPSFITTAALPETGIVADVATSNPVVGVSLARSWILMAAAGIPVVVGVLTQQQQQQQRNALMYQQNVTETELEQFQRRARGQDLRAKTMYATSLLLGAGLWIGQTLGWNDLSLVAGETRPSSTAIAFTLAWGRSAQQPPLPIVQGTVSAAATSKTAIPPEKATASSKAISTSTNNDPLLSSLTEKLFSQEIPGAISRKDLLSTKDGDRLAALTEEQPTQALNEPPQQQRRHQEQTENESKLATPKPTGDSSSYPSESAIFSDETVGAQASKSDVAPSSEKINTEEIPRPLASMATEQSTIGPKLNKDEPPPMNPQPQTIDSAQNDDIPSESEQQRDVLTNSKPQRSPSIADSIDTPTSLSLPYVQPPLQQPEQTLTMAAPATKAHQSVKSQPTDGNDFWPTLQRWKEKSPLATAELQNRFTPSEIPTEVRYFAAGSVLTAAAAFLYNDGKKYLPEKGTTTMAGDQTVDLKVTRSQTVSTENNSAAVAVSDDSKTDVTPVDTKTDKSKQPALLVSSNLAGDSVISNDEDCMDKPYTSRNIRQIVVLPRKETDPTLSFTERTTYYRPKDQISESENENDENKPMVHPIDLSLASVEDSMQNDGDTSPATKADKSFAIAEDVMQNMDGAMLHNTADKKLADVEGIAQDAYGVEPQNEADKHLLVEEVIVQNNDGARPHNETDNLLASDEDSGQNVDDNDGASPRTEAEIPLAAVEAVVQNNDSMYFAVMEDVMQGNDEAMSHNEAGDDVLPDINGITPPNQTVQLETPRTISTDVKEIDSMRFRADGDLSIASGTTATALKAFAIVGDVSVDLSNSTECDDDTDSIRYCSGHADDSLQVHSVVDAAESIARAATEQATVEITPRAQEVSEVCDLQMFRFAAKTPAAAQLVQHHQSLERCESKQRLKIWPRRRNPQAVVVSETKKDTSTLSVSIIKKIRSTMSGSYAQIGETWWSRETLPAPQSSPSTRPYPRDSSPPRLNQDLH